MRILSLQQLLFELGIKLSQPQPPTIFNDNIDANYLCENPVFHTILQGLNLFLKIKDNKL